MQDDKDMQKKQPLEEQTAEIRKMLAKKWHAQQAAQQAGAHATVTPTTTSTTTTSTTELQVLAPKPEEQSVTVTVMSTNQPFPQNDLLNATSLVLDNIIEHIIGHPTTTEDLFNAIKNIIRLRSACKELRNKLTNKTIANFLKTAGFGINDVMNNVKSPGEYSCAFWRNDTPFHAAVIQVAKYKVNANFLRILILLGANVNLSIDTTESMYHQFTPLQLALRFANDRDSGAEEELNEEKSDCICAVIQILIDSGADVNAIVGLSNFGQTFLTVQDVIFQHSMAQCI